MENDSKEQKHLEHLEKEMQKKNELEDEKIKVNKLVERFETEAAVAKGTIKELQEKLERMQQESADIEKRVPISVSHRERFFCR